MRLLTSVLELAGPARCVGCGVRGAAMCGNCRARLREPAHMAPVPNVDRVLAVWEYAGAARALVLRLKLRGARDMALPLALDMCALVARRGLRASLLTWVPGRSADIRRRGFDHSELLAREVGALLGLPVTALLTRARPASDQTGLGAEERRRNLHGVFQGRPTDGFVAVVDDVVTTGATASACGVALKAAGASHVEVVAACHA